MKTEDIKSMNEWQALAHGIILQAVADYREALRIMYNPKAEKGRREAAGFTRDAVRGFFESQWFKALSSLDGSAIVAMLDEEFKRKGPIKNRQVHRVEEKKRAL